MKKRILLERCPKCGYENHAMCVYSGICAWCGYDANKPPKNYPHRAGAYYGTVDVVKVDKKKIKRLTKG